MILAIDTANTPASVALADPAGRLLASAVFAPGDQPAAQLFPVMARLLAEINAPLAAITQLAVCQGPGSFTGIRIGIAAVEGLQLVTRCPIVGISTLTAWAVQVGGSGQATPVQIRVGDGAGGIVRQDFGADGRALTPVVPVTLQDDLCCPPDLARAGPGWGQAPQPLAGAIALAAARGCGDNTQAAPLYLRPSYAEIAAARHPSHPAC